MPSQDPETQPTYTRTRWRRCVFRGMHAVDPTKLDVKGCISCWFTMGREPYWNIAQAGPLPHVCIGRLDSEIAAEVRERRTAA